MGALDLRFAWPLLVAACAASGDPTGGPPETETPVATSTGGSVADYTPPEAGVPPTPVPTTEPTGTSTTEPPPVPPPAPTQEYDPNVHFEWPETEPGGGAGCRAGLYEGSFEGMYSPGITIIGLALAVSGSISVTLAESADGEFFVVENGLLDGVANGSVPFSGTITGRLNCPAKRLEAEIVDGVYTVAGLPYTFAGPLEADYDITTSAMINGVWDVVEPGGLGNLGGNGTWQATLVP